MKIAVIGAGAVGGLFGAALQRSGQDVWFLARGPHLAAMRERGLRITGAREECHLPRVNVTNRPEDIGPVAVALLAVKLWNLDEAVKSLGPLVARETVVVTLQNGVDAPHQVAAALGARHVAAGSCFVNACVSAPGLIVQRSLSQKIVAGMLNGVPSATLEQLQAACRLSDIEFELTDAPFEVLWEKFVQLVPTSAMTALLRRSIGAVRDDRDCWKLFVQLLDETVRVGWATGAHIPPEAVARRVAYVRDMPYDATTSMATDLMHGRRLELPWLSGRISELGRRYGIPTPANDFVVVALKPYVSGEDSWAA